MFNPPKTKHEALARRYGKWSGNPRGLSYDPNRCAYEIAIGERSSLFKQCSRKPSLGPDHIYCAQHARMVEQ